MLKSRALETHLSVTFQKKKKNNKYKTVEIRALWHLAMFVLNTNKRLKTKPSRVLVNDLFEEKYRRRIYYVCENDRQADACVQINFVIEQVFRREQTVPIRERSVVKP